MEVLAIKVFESASGETMENYRIESVREYYEEWSIVIVYAKVHQGSRHLYVLSKLIRKPIILELSGGSS